MDKTDFTIFAPSKKKHLMAKKKADLQAATKPESTGEQREMNKENNAQDTQPEQTRFTIEEPKQPEKALPKAAKKTSKATRESIQDAQPVKVSAKKSASAKTKDKNVPEASAISSLPPENTAPEVLDEPKSAKKAAAKKFSAKKAKPAKDENVFPASSISETATEDSEQVSVTEEKNEAFVHKLTDAAEHHHVIQTQPEAATERIEATPVKNKIRLNNNNQVNLRFIVNYYTKPGQSLFITAQHPLFGNGNPVAALPMSFLDDQHWQAELILNREEADNLVYNYLLREEDGSFVCDGGKDKKLLFSSYQSESVVILDAWDFEGYYGNAFFTEPFTKVLFKNNDTPTQIDEPGNYTHLFKIKAPLLRQGQVACLTGSSDALKNWNTTAPYLLHKNEEENYWQVKIDAGEAGFPLSYKYGVFDINKNELVQLENGDNRVLYHDGKDNTEVIVNDGFIRLSDSSWKGAGVAIPVFSLRTENSWGVGEFADIKKLADWSRSVGLQLIQLLPVNDTTSTKTWKDSYPYAAISAFALHAMYLNMNAMAGKENKSLLEPFEAEAKRLNELPEVDYEAVNDIKWKLIREVYPLEKEATFASNEYKAFFKDNKHWLVPYAVFCTLRDTYNTADVSQWNEYRKYDADAVEHFAGSDEEKDKAGMYYFVQYHLHLQLKDAADYAHSLGIVIKGDIPIGVSRHGADTWQHPELFNMDMQAGAPPDPFAVKGQNWGFPTYNWQRMKEDSFAWWKRRFLQMSNYFDAFRIDHILGFFRIWSIPVESTEGIMGHFVPALPVHINEFRQWNIYFDYKRYTKPFINDQIIADLCGGQAQSVKDIFLIKDEDNTYSLRPEVATQKRVETYFAIREKNAHNDWLKQLLFDLISNVILFEEKGSDGQLFHFRFGMEKTLSYQYMDNWSKHQLYFLSINYFYERQNEFWRNEALQKLPAFKQETDMLVCGEDLGLVPSTVPRVMQDLGLLSLEVQRMPKDDKATFSNLERAPYLSVVTPSTHDMSTIRGWWEEDKPLTQNFYNNQLGRRGSAPQYCEPDINKQIVEQHLYSPAMWSIFQLQDLMGIDGEIRRADPTSERINIPAIPQYYWCYRMQFTLEELITKARFNEELKEMISASGRGV